MTNDDIPKKRKATDQLSPYSKDPNEEFLAELKPVEDQPLPQNFKKARFRRKEPTVAIDLKGVFKNISFANNVVPGTVENTKTLKEDAIAGLNNSFLKAITHVISKQSNKDLRYLFSQYAKYVEEIEKQKNDLN